MCEYKIKFNLWVSVTFFEFLDEDEEQRLAADLISSTMVYRLLLLSLLAVYNVESLSLFPRYSHRRLFTHQTLKIPCRNLYMSDDSSNDIIESIEELDIDKSSSNDIKEVSTNEELDIDGTISSWSRLVSAIPKLKRSTAPPDELDKKILSTALPTMLNLMVVPLVNAVDTFYVGQLADPLALAAQSAANQCFFTIYFLAAFLPTITAPLVAEAIGKEDWTTAKERVCESLYLSNVLGGIFSLILIGWPKLVLRLVLPSSLTEAASVSGAMSVLDYAVPYLRWRAIGMIPALFSATGFAAYRGLLNTITPLKVSLTTNLLNLVLDPLCIFGIKGLGIAAPNNAIMKTIWSGLGASGAAAATSFSELTSSLIYLRLLIRRKLIQWSKLFNAPSMKSLLPLIKGGTAMLLRQMTLNVAFVSAARRAQEMDPSGVSAAGKSALVLFHHVKSSVQYEVSLILTTSFELNLPLFDCPCKPYVLTTSVMSVYLSPSS